MGWQVTVRPPSRPYNVRTEVDMEGLAMRNLRHHLWVGRQKGKARRERGQNSGLVAVTDGRGRPSNLSPVLEVIELPSAHAAQQRVNDLGMPLG